MVSNIYRRELGVFIGINRPNWAEFPNFAWKINDTTLVILGTLVSTRFLRKCLLKEEPRPFLHEKSGFCYEFSSIHKYPRIIASWKANILLKDKNEYHEVGIYMGGS